MGKAPQHDMTWPYDWRGSSPHTNLSPSVWQWTCPAPTWQRSIGHPWENDPENKRQWSNRWILSQYTLHSGQETILIGCIVSFQEGPWLQILITRPIALSYNSLLLLSSFHTPNILESEGAVSWHFCWCCRLCLSVIRIDNYMVPTSSQLFGILPIVLDPYNADRRNWSGLRMATIIVGLEIQLTHTPCRLNFRGVEVVKGWEGWGV